MTHPALTQTDSNQSQRSGKRWKWHLLRIAFTMMMSVANSQQNRWRIRTALNSQKASKWSRWLSLKMKPHSFNHCEKWRHHHHPPAKSHLSPKRLWTFHHRNRFPSSPRVALTRSNSKYSKNPHSWSFPQSLSESWDKFHLLSPFHQFQAPIALLETTHHSLLCSMTKWTGKWISEACMVFMVRLIA